jgi:sulfur-oxidizing protein SoxX
MHLKHTLHAVSAASLLALSTATLAGMPAMDLNGDAEAGKIVANTRATGNCVACHMMPDAESPGAIGPALIAMKARYPDKRDLAAQIWDPTVKNPEVVMPPFGKHGILTDKEFVDVVEYIWSL